MSNASSVVAGGKADVTVNVLDKNGNVITDPAVLSTITGAALTASGFTIVTVNPLSYVLTAPTTSGIYPVNFTCNNAAGVAMPSSGTVTVAPDAAASTTLTLTAA